ncbi:MAG: twin-arginine translocation signal domain-containing protein, partial [Longimicrobiales bacterium]
MAPTRRTFLRTVSAAGAAGATLGLVGCRPGSEERPSRGPEQPAAEKRLPWAKDPSPFIRHPTNLETRLEDLDGFLTPNELFFVRNHAPTPR